MNYHIFYCLKIYKNIEVLGNRPIPIVCLHLLCHEVKGIKIVLMIVLLFSVKLSPVSAEQKCI